MGVVFGFVETQCRLHPHLESCRAIIVVEIRQAFATVGVSKRRQLGSGQQGWHGISKWLVPRLMSRMGWSVLDLPHQVCIGLP